MLETRGIMEQPTRNLSLGERMRCEFIMAMLHGPKVVFLDEPTIGLDVIAKETIHGFIKEMNEGGVTFILTTHDLDDVEYELDLSCMGLESFIAKVGARLRIKDISIQEIPIESVIKELYRRN
jgi:ABC-type uncharacterized transport system ATPase subunit